MASKYCIFNTMAASTRDKNRTNHLVDERRGHVLAQYIVQNILELGLVEFAIAIAVENLFGKSIQSKSTI
jgi:hypothetical protein